MPSQTNGAIAPAPIIPDQNSPNSQAAPEAAAPPKVDAERYAQLSRREKAIRTESLRLKQEKQALEEEKAKRQGYMSAEEYKQRFMSDPTSLGFSSEELSSVTMQQMNADPRDAAIAELRRELNALKGGVDETKNAVQASQQKAVDQALKQISREVSLLVESNDAYETIKATGSQEAVVALIKETYDQDGVILSNEEAAQKVEEYLFNEAVKLATLKKVQSKLAPAEVVPQPTVPKPSNQPQKPLITTLTHAGTPPASAANSERSRRERAMLAFKGQLK